MIYLFIIIFSYFNNVKTLVPFLSNIVDVGSYEELKSAISVGKWARGPWAGRYTNSAVFLSIIFVHKFM